MVRVGAALLAVLRAAADLVRIVEHISDLLHRVFDIVQVRAALREGLQLRGRLVRFFGGGQPLRAPV